MKAKGEMCVDNKECEKGTKCIYRSTSAIFKTCEKFKKLGEECTSSTSILCRPYSGCISPSLNNLTGTC